MEILRSSENLSKADMFKMVKDPKVRKIKEVGGEVLTVTDWVLYTDKNNKGDLVNLLAIKCEEGCFATNSATFIQQFTEIVDFFDGSFSRIEVLEETSKNGRTFYQCSYVD